MHRNHIHIHSKKNIGTELLGKFRSAFLGHGIEFRDFREYSNSDDSKYIDWIASSKEQTLIMRRFQEERDSKLHLIIDESDSVSQSYDIEKYILKNTLTQLITQASIQNGIKYTGWKIGANQTKICNHKNPYINEKKLIQDFGYSLRKEGIFSMKQFVKFKKKKAIYIIISDSIDLDEQSFKALAHTHDVVYLHISSIFENTLSGSGVQALMGEHQAIINLDDTTRKSLYIARRAEELQDFKKKLQSWGIRVGLFESSGNTTLQLIKTLDTHY